MEETPKQDMHRILITEIIKNTELTLIFNKLLNPDYSYSDLFLINKDQIFPDGESGRNYYLLWNNLHNNIEYPENENFSDILEGFLGSSILKTKVELQLIKESQFFGLLINIFLQSPNEFQTDCKDLFFYYLIKFVN